MSQQPAKKRKRTYGTFVCDYDNCGRVFTRADHLSRHKKNHDPSKKLPCTWPNCNQTFARNDIREKHYQRHIFRSQKGSTVSDTTYSSSASPAITPAVDVSSSTMFTTSVPPVIPPPESSLTNSKTYPTDLFDWLFQDNATSRGKVGEFYNFNDLSNSTLLENAFAIIPNFPHAKNRTTIDPKIRQNLLGYLPELATNPDFRIPQIEQCLELYWTIYHPQYPILHKPSFSNWEAHPLLLLAMIMLGASLSSCSETVNALIDPHELAEQIATPLRWLIFSNPECKPPAKVYIIQSLLLLESFEITSTSRFLHERSFLYHGTKIQLLRRSPLLGGDPLKKEVEGPPQAWKQWIEYESMKRACLMAFYLDTVNATVYGHTVILYAYQIQLSLPCEDFLWEYDSQHSKLVSPIYLQTPKFLDALKKVLHREPVQTTRFGRSLLLAGLLSIMFQMQQRDLQLSYLEWNSTKESWNDTMSFAMDVWRTELCPQGCCYTDTAVNIPEIGMLTQPSPMLKPDDSRCKFSLYHIAQIYMRITHYDYIVYAGAPSRMNVSVTDSEYEVVNKRIHAWANSLNGGITVIHAYLLLCEMLLSPLNDEIVFAYDPNADPFLHRRNIIISAVLVIFAYNFSKEGPEIDNFDKQAPNYYPEQEDGYAYLRRVKSELSKSSAGKFHLYPTSGIDAATFHNNINIYAEYLKEIPNKNNVVGLLKIFHSTYRNSKWEVGLEYGNLLRNCIERSLGRKSIKCEDMFIKH